MSTGQRPFKEKFPEFQEELTNLLKKYDLLIFAVIEAHPSALQAVIKVIDDNDNEVKKQYGIIAKDPNPADLLVN